jgi:hypothetical protein
MAGSAQPSLTVQPRPVAGAQSPAPIGGPASYGTGFSNGALSTSTGPLQSAYQNAPQTPAMPSTYQGPAPGTQQLSSATPSMPNVNQAAAMGIYGAGLGAAGEMGYRPMGVGAQNVAGTSYQAPTISGVSPISAQNVQAGQLAQTGLSPYMNPYTEEVIRANEADILRGAQMGLNTLGAQAQAARAYGGSRQGVAEAELGRNVLQQLAQSSAGLRQAGFTQAQQAAQQDIAGAMQAALANQAAGLQAQTTTGQQSLQSQLANQAALQQAGQFGASQAQSAAMANQQAALQAALANQQAGLAGSQQRLAAGSQLANIANLGFGMGQTVQQNLAQQGMQQQALQQALMDAAQAQFAGYQMAPQQSLGYMSTALGATPVPQTTTTSRQPGLFDYLTLGASMYAASDIRLKKDIKQIGELPNGLKTYSWKWNKKAKDLGVDHFPTIGVIAQEAQKVVPHAVMEGADGYLRVNYGEIL